MADRTKDIWNDNDGEEEQRPAKKHRGLRRLLVFVLVLAVVLLVVLVAAYRDGTGFDVLRRYFNYGTVESVSGGTVYEYDASSNNRFAALGDCLVVLSDTRLRVLDKSGEEVWAVSVAMSAPALVQGGDRAVAYDVGGTELYAVGQQGELLHLTADETEPFIAASVNEDGWIAVTAEKQAYKGCVNVYDPSLELVFAFKSSSRFVSDACVTDDDQHLAAVTLGQESGVFVSNVVLYDLSQEDPVADYDVTGGLVMDISGQSGQILTVSDTCLTVASVGGAVKSTYSYGSDYLRGYALGDGFTALLLNRYQSGSVGRLVTVGSDGTELTTLDVTQEVLDISAAGRYLAVLYSDSLVVYNQELQVYATLNGTDFATGVLTRSDGSALLLASEYASLFLP